MTTHSAAACSVVIVTWNALDVVRECVRSVVAQRRFLDALEIIIVDNGSVDGTPAALEAEFPEVRVISSPVNLGFAAGANLGIEASTHDAIVLINNDAVVDVGALRALVDALAENPDTAAVSARMLLFDRYSPAPPGATALVDAAGNRWMKDDDGRILVNSSGGELTTSANGRDRDWLVPAEQQERKSGPVLCFSGGAAVLRRSALEDVGLFDRRYFMYYEDADLSWRLRQAGWTIRYERDAVVRHRHAASSGTETYFFLFHNERNRLLFALKNAPAPVVARAFARTFYSLASLIVRSVGPGRKNERAAAARKFAALGSALRLAPEFLATRRRAALRTSRKEIAALMVPDRS